MTLVTDAIDEQLAELQRLVPTPSAPLGYGVDLSCVLDITPDLAEVDAFTPHGIGEALLRRLQTPRGGLPDDPDYGYDLRGIWNRGIPVSELEQISGQVRNEVRQDDRVYDATVSAQLEGQSRLLVMLRIVPADQTLGTFSLTLAVTSAQVLIEAIGGAA